MRCDDMAPKGKVIHKQSEKLGCDSVRLCFAQTFTKGKLRKHMSHFEAMKLLDKVKEGVPYPLYLINQALELTGDLFEENY